MGLWVCACLSFALLICYLYIWESWNGRLEDNDECALMPEYTTGCYVI